MAVDDDRHPDAERLAEYADGVLQADVRADVERHLAACADCRAVLAETMAFIAAEYAREADHAKELTAAPGESAARVVPFRSRRWLPPVALGLAAAAALVLV